MQTTDNAKGPEAFYLELKSAFGQTLTRFGEEPESIGALCSIAFNAFETNIDAQQEITPQLACRGDCPACCCLRVTVTAPEALLLARFISVNAPAFAERNVDLIGRITSMTASVGSLSEAERMAAGRSCAMLEAGLCLAYKLRPLACRGHASFDAEACAAAIAGQNVDVPVSAEHMLLRSLVQSAMMAAMQEAGLASGLYELDSAVALALTTPDAPRLWARREDPLAKAKIADFDGKVPADFVGAAKL
ncbi:MAG: YkgJ family cysteine cluster protein [Methylocystis sp.]